MSTLRQTAFIARHDLASMLRSKENLLWVFVMPILFFGFIGKVTGGFGGGGDGPEPLALTVADGAAGGFLVDELARRLEEQGYAVSLGADATGEQRRLEVPAPPAGHGSATAAVLAGEPLELVYAYDREGLGAAYEQLRVGRAVYGLLADLAVAAGEGAPVTAETLAELHARPRSLRVAERPAGERLEIPNGFAQAIPGTLVMFTMLVLLTGGAIPLVIERRQGLLRRLASTPIPRGAVVAGKLAAKLALGLVQVAFGMLAGTLIYGMDWGPSLGTLCALLVAWALFNALLGVLLANLARSEAQMAGIGVVSSMVLAALGGCWWPIEITPEWMQQLADGLPTGWAMGALHELVSFGRGPAAALPEMALLLAGALALGWAAVRTFRYQ